MSQNTGNEAFTSVSQSGSGSNTPWDTPLDPESGTADVSFGESGGTKTIRCSAPDFSSVPDGAEFVSFRVRINTQYTGTPGTYTDHAKLSAGSVTFDNTVPSSSTRWTLSGDADYWGLSGSLADMVRDLKSGSMKFHYWVEDNPLNTDFHYTSLDCRLTYVVPDTHRAASLLPIP